MAVATTTAIALGVLALSTAASTGLAYYSAQEQAASAERMGKYNYAVQKAQMEAQEDMARRENMAAANISEYNARTAENEALRAENEAREKARRIRLDNQRLFAAQRARYGAAGVTSEGSPLQVMADSAASGETAVADAIYDGDARRQGLLAQSQIERYKKQFSLLNAQTNEWSGSNAGLFAAPYLMQGRSDAQAARMSGYGSLISGVGSMASIGMKAYKPNTNSGTQTAVAVGGAVS